MTTDRGTVAAGRIVSRREVLKLAAIALAAPAVAPLLVACDSGKHRPGEERSAGRTSNDAALISFPGQQGKLIGAFAEATKPAGAVLLVHDRQGLSHHFVALTARLAQSGYTTLCVDLLSRRGGTAAAGDDARAEQAISGLPREGMVVDLKSGIDELNRRAPTQAIGALGFALGGEMIWRLLDGPQLRVAVPVCGPFPTGTDLHLAKAAIMAMYVEKDRQVNVTQETAEAAIVLAGLKYESKYLLGVDDRFFDETGPSYDKRAADAAYTAILDWFRINLH